MHYALHFSFTVIFFGLTFGSTSAQTDFHQCAANERKNAMFQQIPELAQREMNFEENYRTKKHSEEKSLANYTLPVVVHIIHNGGAENISDAQVLQGIEQLNQAFANEANYASNLGVKTPFQFCLATRRPDGGPTTGINRIESEMTDGSQFDQKVYQLISWEPEHYINIWLVKEICTNAAGCDVVGYAYPPAAHGHVYDGLVVEAGLFGNSPPKSAVVVHEMGHYLGLLHTFEGGCANGDCLASGDRVCDTPPDNSIVPDLPCNYGENSCSTDINANDPNNPFTFNQPDFTDDFMDYGNLNCLTRFTQGQSDRMEFSLLNMRQSLLASDACTAPCPNPSTVFFTTNANFIEPSQTVVFNSTTSNITTLEWTVNGVPFSTQPNTSYTFTTEGAYEVKLTGSNGNPLCDEVSFSKTIKVYCIASADFVGPAGSLVAGSSFAFENISLNASVYTWIVNGTVVGTSENLSFPFYTPGIYEIVLRAENSHCSNDKVRYVEVRDPCDDLTNTFQGDFFAANSLARLPAGDYLATGLWFFNYVARFDNSTSNYFHVQWIKKVTDPTGYEMEYLNMTHGQNNDYFISGETLSPDYQIKHHVLTKMNDDGQMYWHRIFKSQKFDFLSGVAPMNNGGVLTAFSSQQPNKPYALMALDNDGNELWQKTWKPSAPNKEVDINKLEPSLDGGFWAGSGVFTFSGDITSQAGIIKLDELGNQIWFKTYNNDEYRLLYALHLTQLPDGGLLFISRLYKAAPLDNGLALIRTNAEGEILWAKKLQIKGYESQIHWTKNIALNPNGHFAIAFHLYPDISAILEFTEDGEVAWQKYYQPNLYLEYDPGDIITDGDGYLISTLTPIDNTGKIWRTNDFGNAGYCDQVQLNYSLENLPLQINSISPMTDTVLVLLQPFYPAADSVDEGNNYFQYYCLPGTQSNHLDLGLKLTKKKFCQGILEVEMEVCNNGETVIPAGLPINFYDGNPTLFAANLIGYLATADALVPGECANLTYTLSNPTGNNFFAVGNVANNTITPFPLSTGFNAWMTECNAYDNLDTLVFEPYLPPVLWLGADTSICADLPLTLHAPKGFEALLWSDGSADTSLLVVDAGIYWLTATDSCGATQNDTIEVSLVPTPPTLDLGPDVVACPSVPLTISAGDGFASYHWQDGSANPSFTAYQPGIYWLEVSDACGHLQSDTIQFSADVAAIDLGEDVVSCTGHSFQLDAGQGFAHYEWLPDVEIGCTDCQQVTVTPTESRTYLVIAETVNGCLVTDTIRFEIGQAGVSAILDTTICASDTFWINGQAMLPGSSQVFNLTATNGCDSTLQVFVNGVTVSLPAQLEIAFGDSVALAPELGTETPLIFNWSPSENLSCRDCPTPTVSVLAAEVFTLTVSDGQGCADSASVLVKIKKGSRPAYAPNVFSPNNDGINDRFTIYGDSRIKEILSLKVFDRWGGLVFVDNNFEPGTAGWDGISHEKIMDAGVFAFLAEVVWIDEKVEVMSGEVVLMR